MTRSFASYQEGVLSAIEDRLASALQGQDLGDLYRYVVEGGKRVRPTLTLLVSDALGGDRAAALDLACSVELTHCASLALDDILDGQAERRGRPTLHRRDDLRTAVTTGFTLPSVALNLAARHGPACAEALSEAWVAMCLGAYRETAAPASTWEGYLETLELKTGRLFATACGFGAEASRRRPGGYAAYGLHLGNAFQLADDLADGSGAPWRPRLRHQMDSEVRRASAQAARWRALRPEWASLLREIPQDLVARKEAGR